MFKPFAHCVIVLSLGLASAAFGQDGADEGDEEMQGSSELADESDAVGDEEAALEESSDVANEEDIGVDEFVAADESGGAIDEDIEVSTGMEGEQESGEGGSVAEADTGDDTGDGADVEPAEVTDPQTVSNAPSAPAPVAQTPTFATPAPVRVAPHPVSVPADGGDEGCGGRCVGTVVFWNEAKGFGIIKSSGKDIFFNRLGLNGMEVQEKDRVVFEVVDGKKGLNAVKIKKDG